MSGCFGLAGYAVSGEYSNILNLAAPILAIVIGIFGIVAASKRNLWLVGIVSNAFTSIKFGLFPKLWFLFFFSVCSYHGHLDVPLCCVSRPYSSKLERTTCFNRSPASSCRTGYEFCIFRATSRFYRFCVRRFLQRCGHYGRRWGLDIPRIPIVFLHR